MAHDNEIVIKEIHFSHSDGIMMLLVNFLTEWKFFRGFHLYWNLFFLKLTKFFI